jgi:transposase
MSNLCSDLYNRVGLTPTKYQSGETGIDGRISKLGDTSVRKLTEQGESRCPSFAASPNRLQREQSENQ